MIEFFRRSVLSGNGRARLLAVVLAVAASTAFQAKAPAFADSGFPKQIHIAAGERTQGRILRVGVGRSVVIDLAEPVADVLVSNPGIADAVVRTQNRVFVLGNKLGQANLVLFASSGRELASFNLMVEADSSDLQSLIKRLLPRTRISVETLNGSVILTGSAATTADAQAAGDIATRFLGTGGAPESGTASVLNMVAVDEKDQVHLKVTVAEVERSIIKRLGVEMSGTVGIGNYTAGFNMPASYNVNTNVTSQSSLAGSFIAGNTSMAANIEALQRDGVIRTLAEPTLTAISGENANFLAGGEFPIPVGYDNETNTVTLDYKKFGVGLDFTPVVMSGGRISLKIKTEVSELSSEGAVQLSGVSVPALKIRRAESTLELPSGGTLVMAGLLKESYKQSINGVPGLMQLPVLGSLFKSRDFLREQTELVVFVTPYVVTPVAPSQIQRPDQNLMPASDAESVFLNRLNKIFRPSIDVAPQESYHGQVGFIYK
ncbi:pilus assembly protein CpaC [Roseibium suaedae]|uniref:Pilus assembly protein CpaC n=1 Tax=Roseibium suaedae TaxID=735517 RepID=A0A1M7A2S2_9HYPH|nr:pilus assembly protein CpaC [Roseibium suaedae]